MYNISITTPISSNTFDRVWVQNLIINSRVDGKTTATATLKPFNGETTLDQPKTLIIRDVFELAATDSTFANAVNVLLEEIDRQAKLANVI